MDKFTLTHWLILTPTSNLHDRQIMEVHIVDPIDPNIKPNACIVSETISSAINRSWLAYEGRTYIVSMFDEVGQPAIWLDWMNTFRPSLYISCPNPVIDAFIKSFGGI